MAILPASFLGDPASDLWGRLTDAEIATIFPYLNESPVPVGKIAAAYGLRVMTDAMEVDISGKIQKVAENPSRFEITVNIADVAVRQRFTVAHEVAHYLLHRRLIDQEGIVDTILYRSTLSNKLEAEANKLAAAMLMPWQGVMTFCQNRFNRTPIPEDLPEIARAYKVSSLTAGFRLGV